ncbi:MAG: hypothetical protein IT436_00570 [Phycisphaerales bacterium]|nr:hypothetical protein [Phycisphaerales bacterium]
MKSAGTSRRSRGVMVRGVFGLVAIAAGVFAVGAARADVYQYSVGRGANYTQTSSAAPGAAFAWGLLATVVAEEPIVSAGLSFDRPPVVSYELLEGNPNSWYYSSPYYATEAEFLQEFPATTYTLSADLGAGPALGDVFLPADDYMAEIPYFDGTTFDRLHSYDTALAFAGTVNGFTMPAGAEFGLAIVNLVDATPATIWSVELAPGETDFEIPAGLLMPDSEYSIGVTYYSWATIEDAGFGAATAIVQFSRGTGLYFTTLGASCGGCIADLNCDGLVDFADYLEFLNFYDAEDPRVDFNHDGLVDFADYLEFLNYYDAGC